MPIVSQTGLGHVTVISFTNALAPLEALLDGIKAAAPQGTKNGPAAYAAAYGQAKAPIAQVVASLTSVQVNYFAGLGFTEPSSDPSNRTDLTNSAIAAWDQSAAQYMKNQASDGDTARAALEARFHEFDNVLAGKGNVAVTPDH